jgi:type IV protein arginine methyltransferase
MDSESIDLDTRAQEILLAASNHDLETLKPFLRVPGAASVQDPETGFTPLHAAIAACGTALSSKAININDQNTEGPVNGTTNDHTNEAKVAEEEDEDEVDLEKAKATVKELFLSGAIWNDLDVNNETPGCLAWRLGQKELYDLIVEAGIRAELLMNLMGGYEQLPDEDSDEEIEEAVEVSDEPNKDITGQLMADSLPTEAVTEIPSQSKDVNSSDYLNSTLTFTPSKLLDSSSNGVVMSWETPIMTLTSSLLAPTPGLRILNIGFGLGIIDRLFAATKPAAHHIIEAHPSVIAALRDPSPENPFSDFGPEWTERDGGRKNVIHEGRWQDVVPKLLEHGEMFDVIYFDTFAEDYSQLKMFFTEYVVGLLAPDGRFGFFNGLGADRRVCYDVYCRVVECDLADAGLDVEWVDVDVDLGEEGKELGKEGEGEWEGVRRRYWTLDKYRLPVCSFLG